MPIHPFMGKSLVIDRREKDYRGKIFFVVKHPFDGLLRLPIEWTDRSVSLTPPCINGRQLTVDISGLLKLSNALNAATKNLDNNLLSKEINEQIQKDIDKSGESAAGGNVGAVVGTTKAKNRRNLGNSGSKEIPQIKRGGK